MTVTARSLHHAIPERGMRAKSGVRGEDHLREAAYTVAKTKGTNAIQLCPQL